MQNKLEDIIRFICIIWINIKSFFKHLLFFNKKQLKEQLDLMIRNIYIKADAGKISTLDLVDIVFNFCQMYSMITFYPYQELFSRRLIRSVIENDGEEITALFSRQSGKSETVATTVGGMMIILPRLAEMPMFANDPRINRFIDGLWVGIFAPSQRQSQITYMRMKKRLSCKASKTILADPDFGYEFTTSNGQTVGLSNGSFASAISASDQSNIEGESFKFIICEECQDISNFKIRKSIHPMGAAYNATIAKIGTATTFKGDFYEAIERNKRDYKSGKLKIKNHFEFNYKVVMKYNPMYEKYITKEMHRLGEDSDEFQMAYNLKWILARGMFIDIKKFNKCANVDQELLDYDHKNTHVAGIDLAKSSDSTVVTILQVDWDNPVINDTMINEKGEEEQFIAYDTQIVSWLELTGEDYETQYYQILDFIQNFRLAKIVIDATRESSISDRMKANISNIEIIPFVFGLSTKSDLYKTLDREIRSGRAKYPASEKTKETKEYKKFEQQMLDLQKDYRGSTMMVSHPPEKGAHDDYPDSWALAVYGSTEKVEIIIAENNNNNPLYDRTKTQVTLVTRINRITGKRRR